MYYSRRNNVCNKERYGQALTESADFFTFSEYVLYIAGGYSYCTL